MIVVLVLVALVLAVYGILDTWKLRRHTRDELTEVAEILEHLLTRRRR